MLGLQCEVNNSQVRFCKEMEESKSPTGNSHAGPAWPALQEASDLQPDCGGLFPSSLKPSPSLNHSAYPSPDHCSIQERSSCDCA